MDTDDDWDGQCHGHTVYLPDDEHPTLYGPDGEKLRISRQKRIGFDLKPKRKGQA